MSVVVGTLSVDLVARTAAFQGDLGKAAQSARGSFNDIKKSAKDAGDGMSTNMHEARASLALMGEEIGVRIPRHLRNFVISLPGVGTALNAAFNSVAVVALVGVLIEAGKKLYEFSMQAQKAYEKIREESDKTIEQARRQTRELDLAMMAPIQRFKSQMLEADNASKGSWKNVEKLTAELDKLRASASRDPMAPSRMVRTYGEDSPEVKGKIAQINAELAQYNKYRTEVAKYNQDLTETLAKDAEDQTRKHQTELDKRLAAEKKYGELMLLVRQQQAKAATINSNLGYTRLDEVNGPFVGFSDDRGLSSVTANMPVYSGTAEAEKVYTLQTNQNEALKEAQKIYTEIRTPMQVYVDQVQILGTLLEEGKISQEQFNTAERNARKVLGDTTQTWKDLGTNIGETIQQAALFGRSWSDALKAILVELVQVILQMTLLKKLKESMDEEDSGGSGGGGGLGGIFGSLLGGLFGGKHADGGVIPAGTWGITGEAGPEVIYGGVSGVTVFPNGSGASGGATLIYQIDARGADPSVLPRIERALRETEDRAVSRAMAGIHEQRKRTTLWR